MSLRSDLQSGRAIVAPGFGDPMSARVAEAAGFKAIHMSGYWVAANLGYYDVGIVTMSEMVEEVRRICRAVSIPLIADVDNGYGNPLNVIRTIREFEDAGASAVHMEDQTFPKRCGDRPDVDLVDPAEMCAKIRAAVETRRNPDFLIIARTDSFVPKGIEEALMRSKLYRDAGADAIMVHDLQTEADMERCRREIGLPLCATVGNKMNLPSARLLELGVQIQIYSHLLPRAMNLHAPCSTPHASFLKPDS